jgi:uncharacterized protein (TIGR02284 family)
MIGDRPEIGLLTTLTSTLNDSINGYREAAENSEQPRLKEMFRASAEERSQVADRLGQTLRQMGGEPDQDGSLMGKAHQVFLDLKASVMGRDEQAIINEVERGEDYLKAKFETALESDALTGEARLAVQDAYQSIKVGHDRASQLKHSFQA